MAQFELVEHVPQVDYIDSHLHGFQIRHRMKQIITCQRTNNHDATNHNMCLSRREQLRSRDIRGVK